MLFYPIFAPANEGADGGRGGVKNVHSVALDDAPETVRLRPIRCAFVHERSRTVGERPVNDIAMASHPADIGRAPKNIFVAHIEDVFGRGVNADQIAAGGMQDSLRFSGRAAGVENVKRVFAIQRDGGTIKIDMLQFFVPPDIPAFLHLDFVARALEDDHAPYRCAAAQRFIDISL